MYPISKISSWHPSARVLRMIFKTIGVQMAKIRKLRGRWQAQVRRCGMEPHCKSSATKLEAEKWMRDLEAQILLRRYTGYGDIGHHWRWTAYRKLPTRDNFPRQLRYCDPQNVALGRENRCSRFRFSTFPGERHLPPNSLFNLSTFRAHFGYAVIDIQYAHLGGQRPYNP